MSDQVPLPRPPSTAATSTQRTTRAGSCSSRAVVVAPARWPVRCRSWAPCRVQPEVVADESNPKGAGEPAVGRHQPRPPLKEAGVQVSDARPDAWFETGRVSACDGERIRHQWVRRSTSPSTRAGRQGPAAELVPVAGAASRPCVWGDPGLRDDAACPPRSSAAKQELPEPARQAYPRRRGWNAAAPGGPPREVGRRRRAGVRPVRRPVSDDWTRIVMRVGEQFQLEHVVRMRAARRSAPGHRFVDPSPGRMTQTP